MLFKSTKNNPQTRMFCYTYSSVLTFVDSFYQFLYCFMHPLHGARHMRPCIRYTQQRAFCYSFSEKHFRIPPNRMQNISIYLRTNRRAKALFAKRNAHTRKKHKPCCKKYKPYILKYKAHILKQVPCIFCLSKCLKNNMVQKPPNRASARRKSAVGK